MPSIAQQDYIVIAPKVGNTIVVDAYALGQLVKILEKKDTSIFDVILKFLQVNDGEDDPNYEKIVGVYPMSHIIDAYDPWNRVIYSLNVPYTSTQYEGLAAVQEAGEAQKPGVGFKDGLPEFSSNRGYLYEKSTGYFITDLEGHKISVTATDDKLATVAVSEETDPDGIKVPFEEIQKLIGLPITTTMEG